MILSASTVVTLPDNGVSRANSRCSWLCRWLWCTVLMFSPLAWSWSPEGHGWVVLETYNNLSAADRKLLKKHAALVWQTWGSSSRTRWAGESCKQLPQLCFLGYWPDTIRKTSLRDLFRKAGAAVPGPLAPYADDDTSRWHYINAHYIDHGGKPDSHCQLRPQGELPQILSALEASAKLPLTAAQRALVVGFWFHMAADAHQPLHLISGIDKHCRGDRGGGAVCLERGTGGACSLNLHQLWDRAGNTELAQLGSRVPAGTSGAHNAAVMIAELDRHALSLADRIYPASRNFTSRAYGQFVRQTSSQQLQQAIVNLTAQARLYLH